jgi:uncharacterized membrane protein YgcG
MVVMVVVVVVVVVVVMVMVMVVMMMIMVMMMVMIIAVIDMVLTNMIQCREIRGSWLGVCNSVKYYFHSSDYLAAGKQGITAPLDSHQHLDDGGNGEGDGNDNGDGDGGDDGDGDRGSGSDKNIAYTPKHTDRQPHLPRA